ncbi:unnamed protein product [Cylindrotheca closterium]|uniref:Uncharacterized protein n=1 Tax=Cylindrotheca closterium TaxID=2856 RepID=A0AAD2JM44_9STRA|nr:unnamed protein product [Cylindrotheca closterium]
MRQNVLSGVNIGGIEVGGSSSDVKAETKQKALGGKASDRKTLFYLKDAPGATICCVSVSSSAGGQKACGEKKDSATNLCDIASHSSLVLIDKLQFPALYCCCKKLGRGGETFYWDSMSHVGEMGS